MVMTVEEIQQPCICVNHRLAVEVNDRFLLMSGYERQELIGQDILHILNNLLKWNKKIECINNMDTVESCFFFNKLLDFKEARIDVRKTSDADHIYVIFQQVPLISLNNPLSYTHQLISDNLMGIALYSAADFTLLKASKEYERIIYDRHSKMDIVGKKVHEFFIGWEDSAAKKDWKTAIQSKKTHISRECPSINPITGIMEYFDGSFTPILNEDHVKFLVVCLNNVTEKVRYRIQNEKKTLQLQKQRGILEAVIAKQKDLITIIDRHGNIVINNEVAKAWLGSGTFRTIKDIYGTADFFSENGNRIHFEDFCFFSVMQGNKVDNLKMKMMRGNAVKHLNINGTPIFHEDGTFDYAFLSGTDITETIENRQRLMAQKDQLETIMDNMSDAIFIVHQNGEYFLKNKMAKTYYDKEPKVMTDAFKFAEYYELDGRRISAEDMPGSQMMKGKHVIDRMIFMKSPKKHIYLSVSATPIFDQIGNLTLGIVSCRDISDYIVYNETIKAQQEALLELGKREKENLEKVLAMKDDFLALISHEFKTPLTVINSALQTMELLCKSELSDKSQSYLNMIRQNTYRQLRLVNNLLDITKANAGHIKLNNVNVDIVFITRSLVESVNLYAAQKEVTIHFISEAKQKVIALDEEKYERIMLNLLSNAIKFSPRGEEITVKLITGHNNIYVEVTDRGIGISKDKQDIIFERFGQVDSSFTRQAEGTGIGLSLSKLLVHKMDGHISVESEIGKGSTFTVALPWYVINMPEDVPAREYVDSKLIQSMAIEFSDIYF